MKTKQRMKGRIKKATSTTMRKAWSVIACFCMLVTLFPSNFFMQEVQAAEELPEPQSKYYVKFIVKTPSDNAKDSNGGLINVKHDIMLYGRDYINDSDTEVLMFHKHQKFKEAKKDQTITMYEGVTSYFPTKVVMDTNGYQPYGWYNMNVQIWSHENGTPKNLIKETSWFRVHFWWTGYNHDEIDLSNSTFSQGDLDQGVEYKASKPLYPPEYLNNRIHLSQSSVNVAYNDSKVAIDFDVTSVDTYNVKWPSSDLTTDTPGVEIDNQNKKIYFTKELYTDLPSNVDFHAGKASASISLAYESRTLKYDKNTTDSVLYIPADVTRTAGRKLLVSYYIPYRSQYIFQGWSTNKNASPEDTLYHDGDKIILDADKTLYAIWKEVPKTKITGTVQIDDLKSTMIYGDEIKANISNVAPKNANISYQWYRCDDERGNTCSKIVGATKKSYQPVGNINPKESDIGKYLKVVVEGRGTYEGSLSAVGVKLKEIEITKPDKPEFIRSTKDSITIKTIPGQMYLLYKPNSTFPTPIYSTKGWVEATGTELTFTEATNISSKIPLEVGTSYDLYTYVPGKSIYTNSDLSDKQEVATDVDKENLYQVQMKIMKKGYIWTNSGLTFKLKDINGNLYDPEQGVYSGSYKIVIDQNPNNHKLWLDHKVVVVKNKDLTYNLSLDTLVTFYDGRGGNPYGEQTEFAPIWIPYLESMSLANMIPEKKNYEFAGWVNEKGEIETSARNGVSELYATWRLIEVPVTIDETLDGLEWKSSNTYTLVAEDYSIITDLDKVPYGTYHIYVNNEDTGKVFTVNKTNRSATVAYHSVYYWHNGNVVEQKPIVDGMFAANIAGPTVTGYHLDYWATDEHLSSQFAFATHAITDQTNIYAKLAPNTDTPYQVKYHKELPSGDYVDFPAETKTRYGVTGAEIEISSEDANKFANYTINQKKSTNNPRIKADGTTVVHYYYDINRYQVEFKDGNWTINTKSNVLHGDTLVRTADPKKDGYQFEGWYKDEQLTIPWEFSTDMIIQDTTIYAKWLENKVTVQVRKDGEPWNDSQKAFMLINENDEELKYLAGTATPDGTYQINEYIKDEETELETFIPTQVTVVVNNDSPTVIVDYYSVTFYDGNIAYQENDLAPQVLLPGQKPIEPTTTPSKYGGEFVTWVTSDSGTTAFDFTQAIANTTSVYASWNMKGQTYRVDISVTKDGKPWSDHQKKFTLRSTQKPTDQYSDLTSVPAGTYELLDHGKATGITKEIRDSDVMVNLNYYSVIYQDDKNAGDVIQVVLEGQPATAPKKPKAEGYHFLNWMSSESGNTVFDFASPITGKTTLYAKWKGNEVTFKHMLDDQPSSPLHQYILVDKEDESKQYTDMHAMPNGTYRIMYQIALLKFYYNEEVVVSDNDQVKELNYYTVHFQDGNTELKKFYVAKNELVKESLAPEFNKEGYHFVSWASDPDGKQAFDFTNTKVQKEITIYVNDEANAVQVSETLNQNNTPNATGYMVKKQGSTTYEDAKGPLSNGIYALYKTIGHEQILIDDNVVIQDNVVKKDVYLNTVHFDETDVTLTVRRGDTISALPTDPSKEGYVFGGWYKDAEGKAAWDFDHDVVRDETTIYPKWIGNMVTVQVKKDGADWLNHGQSLSLKQQGTLIEETEFGAVKNGTYDIYVNDIDSGVDITVDNGNASAVIDFYTVSFYDGEEAYIQGAFAPQVVLKNQKAMNPSIEPQKEKYHFEMWCLDQSTTTAYEFDENIVGTTNLYAKWSANTAQITYTLNAQKDAQNRYTFIWKLVGDEDHSYTQQDALMNGTYEIYQIEGQETTKTGKTFVINNDSITTQLEYISVSFMDGDTLLEEAIVLTGNNVKEIQTPLKDGYVFAGWYLDQECSVAWDFADVTAATKLYAKWNANQVSIQVNKDGNVWDEHGKTLSLKEQNDATIVMDHEFDAVKNGNYDILVDGKDSGVDLLVKDDKAFAVLDYYTVCFYSDDIAYRQGDWKPQIVLKHEKAVQPTTNPKKANYRFDAWVQDKQSMTKFDFNTAIDHTTSIHAKWLANQIRVHYTIDGQQDEKHRYTYEYYLVGDDEHRYTQADALANGTYQIYQIENDIQTDIEKTVVVQDDAPELTLDYVSVAFKDGEDTLHTAIVMKGNKAKAVMTPVKDGYRFDRWYQDQACTMEWDFNHPVNTKTELYAGWVSNQVNITVQKDGAVWKNHDLVISLKAQDSETEVKATEFDAVKNGSYDILVDGKDSGVDLLVKDDIASAVLDFYTVSFYSDDTAYTYGDWQPQIVLKHQKAMRPATEPTKEKNHFIQWNMDQQGTQAFDFDTAITDTTAVYANWEENQITVKYTIDGQEDEAHRYTYAWSLVDDDSHIYTQGDALSNGTYRIYQIEQGGKKDTGKTVVVNDNSPELTFAYVQVDFKDEEEILHTAIVRKDDQVSAPQDPSKDGYRFAGWYLDKAGTVKWGFDQGVSQKMTVYTKWIPRDDIAYVVAYYQSDLAGNYQLVEQVEHMGTTDTEVGAEIKQYPGFTFNETLSNAKGMVNLDGSLVLNLYYDRADYEVRFQANGGSEVASIVVKYGAKLDKLPVSEKDLAVFQGWYLEETGNTLYDQQAIMGNTVLYAMWKPINYQVHQDDTMKDVTADFTEAFLKGIVEDDTLPSISVGEDVAIHLDVKSKVLSEQEQALLQAYQDRQTVIYPIDISLYFTKNGTSYPITTTKEPLQICIPIPEAYRHLDVPFVMVRIHHDEVEVLADLDQDPNTYTFVSDRFSTYVLAYEKKEEVSNPQEEKKPSGSSDNQIHTVLPNTSDAQHPKEYLLFCMMGLTVMWLLNKKIKKIKQ